MKSAKFLVLFGALSFVFMGCPYESKIPLDTADKAKPDKTLVGKYDEKGEDNYSWSCELEGNQYKIIKKNTEEADSDPTVYIGWLSDIGDAKFMNVYERDEYGSSDKTYYLYRFIKKGEERLVFKAVTDNITEEFATSEELKAFIKKNMELSFFYNKDDEKTFYRAD